PTVPAAAAARVPGLAYGDGVPERGRRSDGRRTQPVPALDAAHAVRQVRQAGGLVKKLFLVLIVVGGATLTVPELRARARPHLEPAFGDVMDWWGRHLRPLLDPAFRWSASNELRTVLRSLRETSQMGQPLPDPSHFHLYVMRKHLSGRGGNDPWG